jgi:hypothetical protein
MEHFGKPVGNRIRAMRKVMVGLPYGHVRVCWSIARFGTQARCPSCNGFVRGTTLYCLGRGSTYLMKNRAEGNKKISPAALFHSQCHDKSRIHFRHHATTTYPGCQCNILISFHKRMPGTEKYHRKKVAESATGADEPEYRGKSRCRAPRPSPHIPTTEGCTNKPFLLQRTHAYTRQDTVILH